MSSTPVCELIDDHAFAQGSSHHEHFHQPFGRLATEVGCWLCGMQMSSRSSKERQALAGEALLCSSGRATCTTIEDGVLSNCEVSLTFCPTRDTWRRLGMII